MSKIGELVFELHQQEDAEFAGYTPVTKSPQILQIEFLREKDKAHRCRALRRDDSRGTAHETLNQFN